MAKKKIDVFDQKKEVRKLARVIGLEQVASQI